MDQTKSKSGKSTYDPATKTWSWTTKRGKTVSRSDDDYQKRIKSLQIARLKRQLDGPKQKHDDAPTSSKKVKTEERSASPPVKEKPKKQEVPTYVKKLMKEIKELKDAKKEVEHKQEDTVDGNDDDVVVLDRSNKQHARILAQPGIQEITDVTEHENDEMNAHDKAFKAMLFQDASIIVPVHDSITDDDKKNITEKPELYTAIFEFDGERLVEAEPNFVPTPTGGLGKRRRLEDDEFYKTTLHDDDHNIVVCNDIISQGKIEIDEAIQETDFSTKVCVPRLASLKCELVQLPRTKVLPTGFNQAAIYHPETGTCDDSPVKFDVWVASVPMQTKRIDAICGTHIDDVQPDNIEETPWGEDPFARQDFEVRAGVQPDNLEDVLWHGEYQATTTTFYESGIVGDKSVPCINDSRKEVELVNNDTDVQTFVQDPTVDVGKFLPTGCLHVYEKYSFQNKNIDPTVPPVDTNDLISVQYLESQAKFRITMQYYLTYWTPLYFLDNPHFDGRKYRPDISSAYTE